MRTIRIMLGVGVLAGTGCVLLGIVATVTFLPNAIAAVLIIMYR